MQDLNVYFPVPVSRVNEVAALLSSPPLQGPPTSQPQKAGTAVAGLPGAGGSFGAVWSPVGKAGDDDVLPWTVAMLRRMYVESGGNMRAALDYLAERGDVEVTTRELAQVLGLPKGAASVAGMIGAFARRCWNRYSRYVPWQSWWQPVEGEDNTTETVFVMPEIVARVLRELKADLETD